MDLRDKLNTKVGYEEIINQRIEFSTKTQKKIIELSEDEAKGVQKHPKPNLEIIKLSNWRLFEDYFEIVKCKYSIGKSIVEIMGDYSKALDYFLISWKPQSRYLQMLDMVSLGVLLEIQDQDFSKLIELLEKYEIQDYILELFIKHRRPNWEVSDNVLWSKLYTTGLIEIIELSHSNKAESLNSLKAYLKKWYGFIEIKTHESKWNIHAGYWSFESGAIAKILGLDDSNLKDQPYYPYDMVHFKD